MKRLMFLLLLLFAAVTVLPVAAQDDDIIEPIPCCGVFTDPSWLKIDYQRVTVTIDDQIATTNVDMQFTNEGEALAEGTFIFPLPAEAAVDELIMYIDGQPIEAKILPADEARAIYDEIVRQYRDPALLEYIGANAIQANVFPIPPGDFRRIEFTYQQALQVDNGLIHYIFPMNSDTLSNRAIGQMNVSVTVTGSDKVSNIYSPSHNIAISREGETNFRTGWEATEYNEGEDFSLYYGIDNDTISVNLLSFRESAAEDGFFMLMVQPPLNVPEDQVIPKDVIVVLDQSGSMTGEKWDQARDAAAYVLSNLKSQDRFNVIVFSTGVRTYSLDMESPTIAGDAIQWLDGLYAEGGTDINASLLTALDMVKPDRATTVLFLTDGVATEGEVFTADILDNLDDAAPENARIFTFGVGDDVDTFLLDQIVDNFNGAGTYVRPSERIDEEVASLYNKISAPVLTDVDLDFGGARVELLYPDTVNDLFAGEQITLVGRYRDGADDLALTISGKVNGEPQTIIYDDLSLRSRAGGEPFIARLWATRRIGDLLNTIRLNGENDELVDSVIALSVRYGIITPYTSFLIEEDDILSQQGRERANEAFTDEAESLASEFTGEGAVQAADDIGGLRNADAPMAAAQPTMSPPMTASPQPNMGGLGGRDDSADMGMEEAEIADGAAPEEQAQRANNPITTVGEKTFILLDGVWTDTTFEPDTMQTEQVVFLSDAYFDLLDEIPELGEFFALGDRVIVVYDGVAYEVIAE